MAEPFAPYAGVEGTALTGGEGGDLLQKLLIGALQGTASIPQRVIDATMATAPGLRREDYTDKPAPMGMVQTWQPGDEQRSAAMETAATLGGISTPFAKSGSLGIFGGRLAKTADLDALKRAERMAEEGADRQAIWDQTGWFKGGDNKWRFEIPDDAARVNPNVYGEGAMPEQAYEGPLAGHLWHKDLYEAYPSARRSHAEFEPSPGQSGYYRPPGGHWEERVSVKAATVPQARSVALHEAQHLVQEREGFSTGGGPAHFTQEEDAKTAARALSYRLELSRLDPSLTPAQKDAIIQKQYDDMGAPDWFPDKKARSWAHDTRGAPQKTLEALRGLYGLDQRVTPYRPHDLYMEIPGEIEARNVQRRADFTPEQRRAIPPWATQDRQPRPIMQELFGRPRVGMLERGQ
jgi:hypothetical protein